MQLLETMQVQGLRAKHYQNRLLQPANSAPSEKAVNRMTMTIALMMMTMKPSCPLQPLTLSPELQSLNPEP